MSKGTVNIVIGIGIISILVAIYGLFKGDEFMDAFSGLLIGVALIGTAMIEKNKKDKSE